MNKSVSLIAKLDSGASQHFFKKEHEIFLKNVTAIDKGPTVQLPDKNTISATHLGTIPLHLNLQPSSTEAFILPQPTNKSLLSIG